MQFIFIWRLALCKWHLWRSLWGKVANQTISTLDTFYINNFVSERNFLSTIFLESAELEHPYVMPLRIPVRCACMAVVTGNIFRCCSIFSCFVPCEASPSSSSPFTLCFRMWDYSSSRSRARLFLPYIVASRSFGWWRRKRIYYFLYSSAIQALDWYKLESFFACVFFFLHLVHFFVRRLIYYCRIDFCAHTIRYATLYSYSFCSPLFFFSVSHWFYLLHFNLIYLEIFYFERACSTRCIVRQRRGAYVYFVIGDNLSRRFD